MSVYTRCTSCQSVYELDAHRLAEAAGVVRCGHCGNTFNSLSSLFDSHPRADEAPLSSAGMPPMLDHRAIEQPELPGVNFDDAPDGDIDSFLPRPEAADSGPTLNLPGLETDPQRASALWGVASLALILVLVVQLGLLLGSADSGLQRWLQNASGPSATSNPLEAIQITSRDMHRHPSLDDAVIVSATLRNRSEDRLSWPVLEVRLYDASQQILGVRRLQPEDYLINPENAELGMPTDVIIPVIFEFVVGTTLPSGFDFRFF
jgi:predicted Zn finger-like uncharacterized protein